VKELQSFALCTFPSSVTWAVHDTPGSRPPLPNKRLSCDVPRAVWQALDMSEASTAVIDARSLYAVPFPHDATLDDMSAVFAAVAPVASLRMRRHLTTKDFRGSVFVEFESEEVAKRVGGCPTAAPSLTLCSLALGRLGLLPPPPPPLPEGPFLQVRAWSRSWNARAAGYQAEGSVVGSCIVRRTFGTSIIRTYSSIYDMEVGSWNL